jgi:integration host factor subunit alpha
MSLGKKDISKAISFKAHITQDCSNEFLRSFLDIIVKNSKSSVVKISNFGNFSTKHTPERVGRNPRTKQEYPIKDRSKVVFKASDHIKKTLN